MANDVIEHCFQTLRQSIDNAVSEQNFTIRAEQQNAIKKQGPYCSLKFINQTNLSRPMHHRQNNVDDVDFTVVQPVKCKFRATFIRDRGALAQTAKYYFKRQSTLDSFIDQRFSILMLSDINNVTIPLEDGYENRASFYIECMSYVFDRETIGTIEIVNSNLDSQ